VAYISQTVEQLHANSRMDSEARDELLDPTWPKGKGRVKPAEYWVICELPPGRRRPSTIGRILNASDLPYGCTDCESFKIYTTEKEAIRHLRDNHIPPGAGDLSKNALREFLVPMRQARESLKIIHLALDLNRCKERLLRLCRCAVDIQGGLLSDDGFSNPLSRLPAALILAFERIVLFTCGMSYQVTYIDKIFRPSPFSQLTRLSVSSLSKGTKVLEGLSKDAERYMHRAQADIVLALSTGKVLQEGNFFDEVGSSYLVGQMMCHLVTMPLIPGLDVVQVYQRYLANWVRMLRNMFQVTLTNIVPIRMRNVDVNQTSGSCRNFASLRTKWSSSRLLSNGK